MRIIILIPIYNDWQSVSQLLKNIDLVVKDINHDFLVYLINDGSTEKKPNNIGSIDNLKSLKIINMTNNIGHARCIATGIKYIYENENFDYIIPMDGDGEDRPEEIKIFVENQTYNENTPIVGERIKRSENLTFKLSYFFHKLITLVFTGKSIKFGNFTFLPKKLLKSY